MAHRPATPTEKPLGLLLPCRSRSAVASCRDLVRSPPRWRFAARRHDQPHCWILAPVVQPSTTPTRGPRLSRALTPVGLARAPRATRAFVLLGMPIAIALLYTACSVLASSLRHRIEQQLGSSTMCRSRTHRGLFWARSLPRKLLYLQVFARSSIRRRSLHAGVRLGSYSRSVQAIFCSLILAASPAGGAAAKPFGVADAEVRRHRCAACGEEKPSRTHPRGWRAAPAKPTTSRWDERKSRGNELMILVSSDRRENNSYFTRKRDSLELFSRLFSNCTEYCNGRPRAHSRVPEGLLHETIFAVTVVTQTGDYAVNLPPVVSQIAGATHWAGPRIPTARHR